MSWKDKISGAFGGVDKKFASHPNDSERASELLLAANKENIGLEEYLYEMTAWLTSQGCDSTHISTELIKIRDLASYLKHD